jgi:hypothetical protein
MARLDHRDCRDRKAYKESQVRKVSKEIQALPVSLVRKESRG